TPIIFPDSALKESFSKIGSVIASAFVKYSAAAIFGGTFGNFAVKYPKVAVFALGIPLLIASFFKVPAYILIPLSVFGSIAVGRFFYVQEHKA
ncbi:MAG: hypothetical protein RR272_03715, partial [Synergistaceae bacterium]